MLWLIFTLAAARRAANPWGEGATTLEWTVSSPPPFHTFDELPRDHAEARALNGAGHRATTALTEPSDMAGSPAAA